MRGLIALCLSLIAFGASAEVFTYVDAQGNRVYTDQPRGNAKRVPLTDEVRRCRYCIYRSLCELGTQAGSVTEWNEDNEDAAVDDFNLDLEQIGEIEF